MTILDIYKSKADLRKVYLNMRKQFALRNQHLFNDNYYQNYCFKIASILENENKKSHKDLVISGFFPIKHELDCLKILHFLEKIPAFSAVKFCLPCTLKNNKLLTFREYKPYSTSMVTGLYNIPEPSSDSPLSMPNVALVPLLAFDEKLHRLGYGGGYYDATLRAIGLQNHILSIGLGYEFQKFHEIPTESTDLVLNYIMTEERIYQKKD